MVTGQNTEPQSLGGSIVPKQANDIATPLGSITPSTVQRGTTNTHRLLKDDPEVSYYQSEANSVIMPPTKELSHNVSVKKIPVDGTKTPDNRNTPIAGKRPMSQNPMPSNLSVSASEIEAIIDRVIEKKLGQMKRQIIEAIREEQRGLHIELIRQFEIQKDMLTTMLDQKAKSNNQMLEEYLKIKNEMDLISKNTF